MCQPAKEACPKKAMQAYLQKEFETIKCDPSYANHIRCGNLKVFEEDKLFHIHAPIPVFLEWRILTFNRLRLDNNHIASKCLKAYLDQQFMAIKEDPAYKARINNGKLKVFDGVMLFNITSPLGDWLEWRILSFNELMRAYPNQSGGSSCYYA